MHSTSLAPELSATRRRDSCWITGSPHPLDDFDDAPALGLGNRPGLLETHAVADFEVVLLVVGVDLLGPLHGLVVARVTDPLGDGDGHSLVHGVRGHDSLPHLAAVRTGRRRARL